MKIKHSPRRLSTKGGTCSLSSLASSTGNLSVKGMRPAAFSCPSGTCNCPSGGTINVSAAFTSATPTCAAPNKYSVPSSGLSGHITETATNCQSGGYTYNGSLTMTVPGTLVNGLPTNGAAPFEICQDGSGDQDLTGSFSMSGTMSVSGSNVNMSSCTVSMDSYMSDDMPSSGGNTFSGAVAWSVTGGNCGSSSGTSSF